MLAGMPTPSEPTVRRSRRLLAAAIGAMAIGNIALALWLPGHDRAKVLDNETKRSARMAEQVLTTRNRYIETIVIPHALGAASAASTWIVDPATIGAATRFAFETSDIQFENGSTIAITSPFPWPDHQDREMTPFQRSAWTTLQANPGQVIQVQTDIDGQRAIRLAVADRMTSGSCLSCHNADPMSPKHDWQLGQVRAVLQIDRVIEGALAAAEQNTHAVVAGVSMGSLILSLALIFLERAFARRRDQHLKAESKIHFLAFHDPMTGLLNRARFSDLFVEALRRDGRSHALTLHLVDLDNFKVINDTYGHAAGDEVIRIAAERLRAVAGSADLVARIGGDEFVVAQIAPASTADTIRLADAIVAQMAEPCQIGAVSFALSASVGVYICPEDGHDAMALFKRADKALYRAKQLGRGCYAVYDADLDRALMERRQIEQRLRAIAEDPDAFSIVYQPLCDVRFGEVRGFEALMRIDDHANAPISADVFIPIAEDMGLIAEIGAHMLNRALRYALNFPDPLTIAVNLSPRQFFVADPGQSIVEITRRALAATGFPAHRLELEITEGLFLQSTDHVAAQLQGLKELGVKLALDDFGVGYCSLGYLSRFPVDKLKIDKSFLSDAIARPAQIVPILQTIATLGTTLGLTVVAEGIETVEQAEIAERVGCTQLQGFYFCRPLEATDVASYILCNQIGTRRLAAAVTADQGESGSFWSRLAWAETSGTWSPGRDRSLPPPRPPRLPDQASLASTKARTAG